MTTFSRSTSSIATLDMQPTRPSSADSGIVRLGSADSHSLTGLGSAWLSELCGARIPTGFSATALRVEAAVRGANTTRKMKGVYLHAGLASLAKTHSLTGLPEETSTSTGSGKTVVHTVAVKFHGASGVGSAPKKKAAREAAFDAMAVSLEKALSRVKLDECPAEFLPVPPSIVAFRPPPPHWFVDGGVVGVDFEGSPPTLAQIACDQGVYVDRLSKAREVLQNKNLTHFVFGDPSEEKRVASPLNTQKVCKERWPLPYGIANYSLEGALSVAVENVAKTSVKLKKKNKDLRKTTDWSLADELSYKAIEYAATDAHATLLLGKLLAARDFCE